jgi:hypothetical protein
MDRKSDSKMSSLSFIKTHSNSLEFENIPVVDKHIPVISCIGTSRDGKSTLLDFYCKWIMEKFNLEPKPKYPFIAKETDGETMTNGIDYYQVQDKCMLIDCQGMALTNAKFDSHLSLIVYLISNVIILTVRQRLDLQVFNNLISMFSFLPDIEEQFRRKDKPKLIIRIKDSPYEKRLKKDNMFLNNMVRRWLEKTGDQYDVIKQAFDDAFDIYVIATSYPVQNEKINTSSNPVEQDIKRASEFDQNQGQDPDQDVVMNIYDEDFSTLNPSFVKACETINHLSIGAVPSRLMQDSKLLINLIQNLKTNAKIDFRKLDLYHNIITIKLSEYSRNHILQEPYTDQSIVDAMDGSSIASTRYKERHLLIKELIDQAMNIKFKDVPEDIKLEIFEKDFARITGYAEEAQRKNQRIAEDIIAPDWAFFCKKFDGTEFEKMIHGFIDIFIDREKEFLKKLTKLDNNIQQIYIDLLEKERRILEEKQHYINQQNICQKDRINERIRIFNIDRSVKSQIMEFMNGVNTANMRYNDKIETLESTIRKKVTIELEKIYGELNYIRYLACDHNVYVKIQSATSKDINDMIDINSSLLGRPEFSKCYLEKLHNRLMEIGFLKDVIYASSIPGIKFVEFSTGDDVYCMVEQFYTDKFHFVLKQIIDQYPYINIDQKEPSVGPIKNVRQVVLTTRMGPNMDFYKKSTIKRTLHYIITEKILMFCYVNGLQII